MSVPAFATVCDLRCRALVGGPIAGALLTVDHRKYTNMIVFSGTTVIVGSFFILGSKLMINSRVLARV